MRRKTTKKSSTIKTLAIATTIAALSAGSLNIHANNNAGFFRVGPQGANIPTSTLHQPQNAAHLQSILDAFHNADPLFIGDDDSDWRELSARASADDFFTDVNNVPEWAPYF